METKNKTPTNENAIKAAIIKLRQEMREHAKLKTLNTRAELNYIYKQLEKMLEL